MMDNTIVSQIIDFVKFNYDRKEWVEERNGPKKENLIERESFMFIKSMVKVDKVLNEMKIDMNTLLKNVYPMSKAKESIWGPFISDDHQHIIWQTCQYSSKISLEEGL